MIDLRTVSISGAFNYSRARVLWKDGMLKVFGVDGMMLELISEKPVRNRGRLNSWRIKTGKGDIMTRGKCMTCGGRKWWRIIYMAKNELWNSI
jgi:hypothetical protein